MPAPPSTDSTPQEGLFLAMGWAMTDFFPTYHFLQPLGLNTVRPSTVVLPSPSLPSVSGLVLMFSYHSQILAHISLDEDRVTPVWS